VRLRIWSKKEGPTQGVRAGPGLNPMEELGCQRHDIQARLYPRMGRANGQRCGTDKQPARALPEAGRDASCRPPQTTTRLAGRRCRRQTAHGTTRTSERFHIAQRALAPHLGVRAWSPGAAGQGSSQGQAAPGTA
jgi:hypothetical protein